MLLFEPSFHARIIIPRILIISLRKRLFDTPDARKVHKRLVSRLGGVSFFPVILFTVTFLIGICYMTGWVSLVDTGQHWVQVLFMWDRLAYDKAVDRYNVSRIVENDIREQGITEGKAEGKARGRAEGEAEGLAEGLAKGLAKGRLDIARKLKANGLSVEFIVQTTQLSAEEMEGL